MRLKCHIYLTILTVLTAAASNAQVTSVEKAAHNIEISLGRRIVVDPSISRLPVLVVPHGASSLEQLQYLAVAVHGSVQESGEGLKLLRSNADHADCLKAHSDLGISWLSQRFQAWDRQIDQIRPFGSQVNQLEEVIRANARTTEYVHAHPTDLAARKDLWLSTFTPAGRLLRNLVQRIGFKKLSEVGTDDRVFFSNSPTPDEVLIQNCDPDLKTFISEENVLHNDLIAQKLEHEFKVIGETSIGAKDILPSTEGIKVLLTVTRLVAEINVHVEVYDPSGERIDRAFVTTNGESTYMLSMDSMAEKYFSSPTSTWIGLLPDSRCFSEIEQLGFQGNQTISQNSSSSAPWLNYRLNCLNVDKLPPFITHPEEFEPDNYVVGEALLALAERSPQLPFICQIPDQLWKYALRSVKSGRINLSAFERFLFHEAGCEAVSVGKALIIRPNDPLGSDIHFADRVRIGQTIRSFIKHRQVSLREWCTCMHSLGTAATSPVARWYLSALKRSLPSFSPETESLVYRFIGSLDEAGLIEEVFNKGAVSLRGGEADFSRLKAIVKTGVLETQIPPSQPDIYKHALELFPNGLEENIPCKIYLTTSDFASQVRNGENSAAAVFPRSAPTIARQYVQYYHSTMEFLQKEKMQQSASKVAENILKGISGDWKYGHMHRIEFRIELPNSAYMSQSFYEVSDLEEVPVAFTQLPEAFLQEVTNYLINSQPSTASTIVPQDPPVKIHPYER